MKLTTPQIEHAEDQLQSAAISENAEVMTELRNIYGDHTFFIDPDGLHILEAFGEDQPADGNGEVLTVVQLASWTDENRTNVTTHEPRRTDKQLVTADLPPDQPA